MHGLYVGNDAGNDAGTDAGNQPLATWRTR